MDKHARGDADLPSPTNHIDTDALDTLFDCNAPGAPRISDTSLGFDYADFVVTVESVGRAKVRGAGR